MGGVAGVGVPRGRDVAVLDVGTGAGCIYPLIGAREYGGKAGELWCEGGEFGFVRRMISESAARPRLCRWFTTLVARGATLPRLRRALDDAGASEVRVLELSHGARQSRSLAWSFSGG